MAYKGACPLTNLRNSVSKAYKCVAIAPLKERFAPLKERFAPLKERFAPLKERLHQERAMNTYFPGVARVFFTCLYTLSFNRQKLPVGYTMY